MDLLDLVWPKRCVGCGKTGSYVCEQCKVGMWEEEQICPACRRASRYGLRHEYCQRKGCLDGLICFWAYEGMTRKLISDVKYRFYYDYLRELSVTNYQFTDRPEFTYFLQFVEVKPVAVPVPLHEERQNWRGFNQAEMVAQSAAQRWRLETKNLLVRVKKTGQQVGRTREERLGAIEGAFQINRKSQITNDKILLVDDVWTTGATMQEAARTLRKAGAKKIWGMALAR